MVSMHPLAFLAANAASFSENSDVKSEVALPSLHESSAFAETQQRSSKAPINPFGGDECPKFDQTGVSGSPLHFVFIVHGHQGRPTDLSYLHGAIRKKAKEKGVFTNVSSSASCVVGRINKVHFAQNNSLGKIRRRKRDRLPFDVESSLDSHKNCQSDLNLVDSTENKKARGHLIVHNAVCNEGKTHDGIIKGGERLLDEMLSVISSEVISREQEWPEHKEDFKERDPVDITISIVGNSLGGLYARYAIAHLADVLGKEPCNNHYLFEGYIRIHFNVFCSTASPHLGCANFTYIPIPRAAEMVVAQILGETGSDL